MSIFDSVKYPYRVTSLPTVFLTYLEMIYMRIGLLISCSNTDAKKLIDMIDAICKEHDAKLVFSMKTLNEIRLVEKKPEEIS